MSVNNEDTCYIIIYLLVRLIEDLGYQPILCLALSQAKIRTGLNFSSLSPKLRGWMDDMSCLERFWKEW